MPGIPFSCISISWLDPFKSTSRNTIQCRYRPAIQMQRMSSKQNRRNTMSPCLDQNPVARPALLLYFRCSAFLVRAHRSSDARIHILNILDVGVGIGPEGPNISPASKVSFVSWKLMAPKTYQKLSSRSAAPCLASCLHTSWMKLPIL